jgi:hypothetical protein
MPFGYNLLEQWSEADDEKNPAAIPFNNTEQ